MQAEMAGYAEQGDERGGVRQRAETIGPEVASHQHRGHEPHPQGKDLFAQDPGGVVEVRPKPLVGVGKHRGGSLVRAGLFYPQKKRRGRSPAVLIPFGNPVDQTTLNRSCPWIPRTRGRH